MMRSKISKTLRGSTSRPVSSQHFAADRVLQALADFQRAARQRPPAFQRLLAALRHQDAVAAEDDRADADQRPLGIAAVVDSHRSIRSLDVQARAVDDAACGDEQRLESASPKPQFEAAAVQFDACGAACLRAL